MARRHSFRQMVLGCVLVVFASCAHGQVKKDVPYVPTPETVVAEMLKQAEVKKGDLVYDLGCGDGRIVITAAKEKGARGVGVDIDPERIAESNENARKAGVADRVKFVTEDLFKMDFRDADVVCLYLLTSVNERLRPILLEQLRPGVRVVSHAFDMGDWKPDNKVTVQPGGQTVYMWVVPAKVSGKWDGTVKAAGGEQKAEFQIEQEFQQVRGTVNVGGRMHQIAEGRLRGSELTFSLPDQGNGGTKYTCTIDGRMLRGTARNGDGSIQQDVVASRQ